MVGKKELNNLDSKIKNPEKIRGSLKNFGSHTLTNGARVAEVEEPLFGVKSILFELEFDEVSESKALSTANVKHLIKLEGSVVRAAEKIGASEAFVRQNAKVRP